VALHIPTLFYLTFTHYVSVETGCHTNNGAVAPHHWKTFLQILQDRFERPTALKKTLQVA